MTRAESDALLTEWTEECAGQWIVRREMPNGLLVGTVMRDARFTAPAWCGNVHAYRHTSHLELHGPSLYRATREDASRAVDALMDELAEWFGWTRTTREEESSDA